MHLTVLFGRSHYLDVAIEYNYRHALGLSKVPR